MRVGALLVALLMLGGCWKSREVVLKKYEVHKAAQSRCMARLEAPGRPIGVLDRFRTCWYGAHLGAMGEPALEATTAVTTYRFLWLRTFHNPVAVRVEQAEGGRWRLTAKRLDGTGGYQPGDLILDRVVWVAGQTFETAVGRHLERADVWNPSALLEKDQQLGGLDGAQWILEAVKDGRYRVVDLWTPETGTGERIKAFQEAMLGLLRLGGVDAEPVY